jgi:hypothetical protein
MMALPTKKFKVNKYEEPVEANTDVALMKLSDAVTENVGGKKEGESGEYSLQPPFQERIMDLLSNEGEMPVWQIANKLRQDDKSIIHHQLEAMELRGCVEKTMRNGVKVWRTID